MLLRPTPALAVLCALAAPLSAAAQGFSTDIELVRPAFSPRSTFGVDSPYIGGEGHLSIGIQPAYVRDPLRLLEFDRVTGPVVRNRLGAHVGFAWAPSRRVSLRAALPLAWQWGSKVDAYRADGVGFGDVSAGLRYQALETDGFTLALHGDFVLNVGTRNAYLGEAQPRTAFGALAGYERGDLLILGNLGVQTRSSLDTNLDFTLGNELVVGGAGIWTVGLDGSAFTGEVVSRFGMARLFTGGAESSVEWLAGLQVPLDDRFRVHVGVGRGITTGYGTSAFRALASIRYERTPPPVVDEPEFVVSVLDIPEDLIEEPDPEPPAEPPPTGEWREGELARVMVDRIEIREPIQFEFATSRILPVSLPLLKQVAGLLNKNASIGHLLIEGHASQEGSYVYNYDLSIRRARAVWEQLLVLGVHPARMSYRGMGKVMPLSDATDEASLAANRRVEFKIIHQYQPGDALPDYPTQVKLPWSGDPTQVEFPREFPGARTVPAGAQAPAPSGSPAPPQPAPTTAPGTPLPPPPEVTPSPVQDPQ